MGDLEGIQFLCLAVKVVTLNRCLSRLELDRFSWVNRGGIALILPF